MLESIEQGETSLTILGYEALVETFQGKEGQFFYDVMHDKYLLIEERTRQPLVFLAEETGDIMY